MRGRHRGSVKAHSDLDRKGEPPVKAERRAALRPDSGPVALCDPVLHLGDETVETPTI